MKNDINKWNRKESIGDIHSYTSRKYSHYCKHSFFFIGHQSLKIVAMFEHWRIDILFSKCENQWYRNNFEEKICRKKKIKKKYINKSINVAKLIRLNFFFGSLYRWNQTYHVPSSSDTCWRRIKYRLHYYFLNFLFFLATTKKMTISWSFWSYALKRIYSFTDVIACVCWDKWILDSKFCFNTWKFLFNFIL